MSQKRQNGIFVRSGDRKSAITTLTYDYPAGHVVPLHFHDRDQLVYASRGHVGSYSKRNVGCSSAPCSLDSGRDAARDYDVRVGGDANPVSETTPRKTAATRLLRDQCLNSAQGTDSSRLYRAYLEGIGEMANASGGGHSSSTGSGADDPVATPAFVGSQAGSNRRNTDERSARFSNSRSALQSDWGGKT